MRIGIDLDNTIICYDDVFLGVARHLGVSLPASCQTKLEIKNFLLAEGRAIDWMRLQGQAYGLGMPLAKLYDGVDEFIRTCRQKQTPLVIVSHKSRYGHFDAERTDLCQAALEWLGAQGFFHDDQLGMKVRDVYFEETRDRKIDMIAGLDLSVFIDDLPEVFQSPLFPDSTRAILFSPGISSPDTGPYQVCSSWRQIGDKVFQDR